MKFRIYFEEHALLLILHLFLALCLSGFLLVTGTYPEAILWILTAWFFILVIYCGMDYQRKKRRYREIEETFDSLTEKYLFTELIKRPADSMERLYYECSRSANQEMINQIESARKDSREYKEYVESWIHEVKSPLTAIGLYCSNHPAGQGDLLKHELGRLEELIDQALYYARSYSVEKDYFVKSFPVMEAVLPVLQDYRSLILEKHLSLEVGDLEETVYTDPKWVSYIVRQLLSNAVKYVEENTGSIRIHLRKEARGLWLDIEDNGCGIPSWDLPRVTEKAFTGSNRKKKAATGMGLYLADRLCKKLGLSLKITSTEGTGTKASIGFPIGGHHRLSE